MKYIMPKVGDYVKLNDSCIRYCKVTSTNKKDQRFNIMKFKCEEDIDYKKHHNATCFRCQLKKSRERYTFHIQGICERGRIQKIMTKEEIMDEIFIEAL